MSDPRSPNPSETPRPAPGGAGTGTSNAPEKEPAAQPTKQEPPTTPDRR